MKKLLTFNFSLITQKGFTLIELAIVLVIVGLLVGMGAGLMGPLTRRAKVMETKEILNAAVDSTISYGASNNRLPDAATFQSVVRRRNDVWNKPLYYIFDNNLTNTTIGGICGRKSTNITVNICPNAACTSPQVVSNVAFIVLSSGENFNNQTAGSQAVASAVTRNIYDVGLSLDNYATDMNRPEPYDDIYKWITIDELRTKVGCTGAQLKVVNNELPYGFQGISYNASIYAEGGVPFTGTQYRWCRQESAVSGLTFSPSVLSADCSALTELSWGLSGNLTISGTPSGSGSYRITFFVRDNNDSSGSNDNITQKTLVLTVNPVVCSSYRVWNNTGNTRDFLVDATCKTVLNNNEVTTPQMLNSGETIVRYNTPNGTCGGGTSNLSYNQAMTADTNGDCCVNHSGSDRTCP